MSSSVFAVFLDCARNDKARCSVTSSAVEKRSNIAVVVFSTAQLVVIKLSPVYIAKKTVPKKSYHF